MAVAGLLVALGSLRRQVRTLRRVADDLRRQTVPLVADAHRVVDQAATEMERVGAVLDSTESVHATVDSASSWPTGPSPIRWSRCWPCGPGRPPASGGWPRARRPSDRQRRVTAATGHRNGLSRAQAHLLAGDRGGHRGRHRRCGPSARSGAPCSRPRPGCSPTRWWSRWAGRRDRWPASAGDRVRDALSSGRDEMLRREEELWSDLAAQGVAADLAVPSAQAPLRVAGCRRPRGARRVRRARSEAHASDGEVPLHLAR